MPKKTDSVVWTPCVPPNNNSETEGAHVPTVFSGEHKVLDVGFVVRIYKHMRMNNPIKLVADPVSREDIDELCLWLQQNPTPQLSKAKITREFERRWAEETGRKFSVFCNSGSSANLLMIDALNLEGDFKNKKIVVPALAWITTISPIIQLGYQPILCDINLNDLSVDLNQLEDIFQREKPTAFFLVSILGLVPDMQAIIELCTKYGVTLLLDNCESGGSRYKGRMLEDFGRICSSSHYVGHQIVAIEGGSISTDDENLYNRCLMLRSHGWDRDLAASKQKELRLSSNASKFQQLYTFYSTAYNFRGTEINAFVGLQNLSKMDQIVSARHKNFKMYQRTIQNSYWKPFQNENCTVSNLGYPVIHPLRDEIAEALRGNNIECRPLISGSMSTQPFFVSRYGKTSMPVAERLNDEGMYIPNHPGLSETDIAQVCQIINRFTT